MNISGVTTAANLYASTGNSGRSVSLSSSATRTGAPQAGQQLSSDEQKQVQKLKERDRQVRQHEQAHMSAGAGLVTSSARFTYQKGPDGVNYAIGGEVGISTSPGRTPDETIQRAQQIRAAALAPADPSGQDRAVAAQAAQMEQQAQMEKSQQPDPDMRNGGGAEIQTALSQAYTAGQSAEVKGLSDYA